MIRQPLSEATLTPAMFEVETLSNNFRAGTKLLFDVPKVFEQVSSFDVFENCSIPDIEVSSDHHRRRRLSVHALLAATIVKNDLDSIVSRIALWTGHIRKANGSAGLHLHMTVIVSCNSSYDSTREPLLPSWTMLSKRQREDDAAETTSGRSKAYLPNLSLD